MSQSPSDTPPHGHDPVSRVPPQIAIPQSHYGNINSNSTSHHNQSAQLFSLPNPAFQMPNTPSGSSATSSPPFSASVSHYWICFWRGKDSSDFLFNSLSKFNRHCWITAPKFPTTTLFPVLTLIRPVIITLSKWKKIIISYAHFFIFSGELQTDKSFSVDPSEQQHSLRVHQRTPPEQRPWLANQLLFRTWTLAAVNSYNVFIIYPFTLIVSFSHHTFTNSLLDYWYPGQCKMLSCFVELSYYILVQGSIVVFWHYIVCHYLLFFFLRETNCMYVCDLRKRSLRQADLLF